jgi:hypothetical protein
MSLTPALGLKNERKCRITDHVQESANSDYRASGIVDNKIRLVCLLELGGARNPWTDVTIARPVAERQSCRKDSMWCTDKRDGNEGISPAGKPDDGPRYIANHGSARSDILID